MDFHKHELNRKWWDDVTPHHVQSRFYDLPAFLGGKSSLLPLEAKSLGDVKGKRLLHLQCHFGMDTLSFARQGARVTGVDFSKVAVEKARQLAGECGLEDTANFVEADVLQWHEKAKPEFDIVFTSYGVLTWLSDLKLWAKAVAKSLKPGGHFYMVEIHPLCEAMDEREREGGRLRYPMLGEARPHGIEQDGQDYASAHVSKHGNWQWTHLTSEVIQLLIDEGLTITGYREHPFCCYGPLAGMTQRDDGYWTLPEGSVAFPMLYEVEARKLGLGEVGEI